MAQRTCARGGDTEPLADGTAGAIGGDHVGCPDFPLGAAPAVAQRGCHAGFVLLEAEALGAEA